jgi:hypothetical protein
LARHQIQLVIGELILPIRQHLSSVNRSRSRSHLPDLPLAIPTKQLVEINIKIATQLIQRLHTLIVLVCLRKIGSVRESKEDFPGCQTRCSYIMYIQFDDSLVIVQT